ncbi:hypothetical protein CKM354_000398400 [Cercospora kikuchii]|uniref:F-box domain-containing protein n=1 Tax=Cercospora kikuchii TaxID=84275 RepID=A0A9P3CHT0_9PEZI|nr:uncharacterized protein CKM354_000398400 [Cercospora kikuchii]GIZ40655.1 hypothetical protein CKM354_000398400 [Cercospora kikuchii]
MAANLHLDTLPQELITQIATASDAYSVLQLALTCHKIRAACYDVLTFKEIMERSQRLQWRKDLLDIAAIQRRCGKDVRAWTRYAIANELTIRYAQEQQSTLAPPVEATEKGTALSNMPWSTLAPNIRVNGSKEIAMLWLPELFLVRHPFLLDGFWRVYLDSPPAVLRVKHMFCLTMAVLGASGQMIGLERALGASRGRTLVSGDTMTVHLWNLCWMILQIRASVKTRLAAWPYNDSARVPYIPVPAVADISSQPLQTRYEIPLPLENEFDEWYQNHTTAMATEEYMTKGRFKGYYCYFGTFALAPPRLDPPMMNINFTKDQDAQIKDQLCLKAENCVDGVDTFVIQGSIQAGYSDNTPLFRAKKRYSHGTMWDWQLRLTPFGLVGYWGTLSDEGLQRNGSVWLWKSEDGT